MEIYHGCNTSFSSLLSALFMLCFESLYDDRKGLMSVVFIGYLYKEWLFKYTNKVKCDVATQEVLLTAEYPLPEKHCLLNFYCQCHLNVRCLAMLLAAQVCHTQKDRTDQKWQNNHKSLCNRCFSRILNDIKLILKTFTRSYAALTVLWFQFYLSQPLLCCWPE